ncbi:MAG: hypothetical protein GY699_12785 [Desulfobacteraceae bacterium]|nr:hypothetical protein [Desulfobacteraceae bacterium]
MDFDSIITFLFIIVFFVLPSIFKQIRAKSKKAGSSGKTEQKPSIFGRIGEQIQQFVQELEKQAQQQKQGQKEPSTVWETFEEDQEELPQFETAGRDTSYDEPEGFVSKEALIPEVDPVPDRVVKPKKQAPPQVKQPVMQSSSSQSRFRSNQLQNAVIWSEILGKPLALRDE